MEFGEKKGILFSGGFDCQIYQHLFFEKSKFIKPKILKSYSTTNPNPKEKFNVNPPFVHRISLKNKNLLAGLGSGEILISQNNSTTIFEAHKLAVTQVEFGKFGNELFISGGLDNFVKIWGFENEYQKNLYTFNVESKVNWLTSTKEKIFVATQQKDILQLNILN